MSDRFAPKFNLYICKIVLSLTLFCVLYYPTHSQETAAKAVKKLEQIKRARELEYEQNRNKAIQHHIEIQGKEAQKRMKKNKKITENYYNKKLHYKWLKKLWFNIKRKR